MKRIRILGHYWTVSLLSKSAFLKRFGASSVGIADLDARQIFITKIRNRREVVIHELVHAYIHEMCLDVADLSSEQMEEVCGDLIAKYGERIMLQADQILA